MLRVLQNLEESVAPLVRHHESDIPGHFLEIGLSWFQQGLLSVPQSLCLVAAVAVEVPQAEK